MSSSPTLRDRGALLLGQWFGTGLSPIAPGTAGSLGAIPLYLLLANTGWVYWLVTAATVVLGIPISQSCANHLKEKDPGSVVIDEVAGVLLALGPLQMLPWPFLIGGWVLFRVLDITKPWLIDRVQHLSPPGLGIMADDVLAGIAAGAITWAAAQPFHI